MSLLNGFQGQQAARQPNRAAAQDPAAGWGQQTQAPQYPEHAKQAQLQPQEPQWGQPAQQPQTYSQPGYAPSYGGGQPASNFGQGQDYHFPQAAPQTQGFGSVAAHPYAPQFEPYGQASQQTRTAPPQQAAQPQHYQHPAQQAYPPQPSGYPAQDYRSQQHSQPHQQPASWGAPQHQPGAGFDTGYGAPAQSASYRPQHEPQYHEVEPSLGDWSQQQGYEGASQDEMGFAQAAGGELDPNYGEEELEEEYESDTPSRFRRPVMIAAALAGAILIGGGMAQGYKKFFAVSTGEPPTVKSAVEPSKVKPADAGGKQFEHSDSKIMGRLGDGSGPADASASGAPAGDVDANGSRKVATLVVGRDGSIQAPAASAPVPQTSAPQASAPEASAPSAVSVPGMTVVDAFGAQKAPPAAAAAAPAAPASQKIVVAPPAAPPQKPVTIAKAAVTPDPSQQTGSIEDAAAAAPAPPPVKKVKNLAAAAAPAAAPAGAASNSVATTGSGSNGFVAVLASVPRSDSSRMTALKQFADMQQKYGSVLAGKTPDVAEANLGTKGNYHRLVVGPPGSRDQASTVCSQLKAQGFNDCWVTSY